MKRLLLVMLLALTACGGSGLQAYLELGANGILTSAGDTSPCNS